jgi:hypothetical protein
VAVEGESWQMRANKARAESLAWCDAYEDF